MRYAHRHFYSTHAVQRVVLDQVKALINEQKPDLCCFVEVDSGSFHSARLNQLEALINDDYPFYDIACKYGEGSPFAGMPLHRGKSNAFIARYAIEFSKRYFNSGSKRLIYQFTMPHGGVHVFFAHFSLNYATRLRQFAELQALLESVQGDKIVLGDFNIFKGIGELQPMLTHTGLKMLNNDALHTFSFHRQKHMLDLCLCSPALAEKATLSIIPQPFSDHAALLVHVAD